MAGNRRPRDEVGKFVQLLHREMPTEADYLIGGSWRRNAPTIGDLDVVIVTPDGQFGDFQFPKSFEAVRRGTQIVNGKLHHNATGDEIGCDFWACRNEQIGAFLMFITGPAALNIAQRAHAQKLGFTLSQYGLLDHKGNLIETVTEQDVYRRLGIEWIEPTNRQKWAEDKPPSDAKVEVQTWKVPSFTSDAVYTVTRKVWPPHLSTGDSWECDCKGFMYSRKAPRSCKHIDNKKREEK